MTPPYAAEREPSSAPRPVALERFNGVRGTARIITARGGKQMAKTHLVAAHDQNEDGSHHETLGAEGGTDSAGAGSMDTGGGLQRASCMSMRSTSF